MSKNTKSSESTNWDHNMASRFGISSDISKDRVENIKFISPFVERFKKGIFPTDIAQSRLEKFRTSMKDEGNETFKDKEYKKAYDLYTAALNVCKQIEVKYSSKVDPTFLSTLFSNRAACLLKMDNFKDCINDCNLAIQHNSENIKAYYRLASAYKKLKDWQSAMTAASDGKRRSQAQNKSTEVKDFDELLREIGVHIDSPHGSTSSNGLGDIDTIPDESAIPSNAPNIAKSGKSKKKAKERTEVSVKQPNTSTVTTSTRQDQVSKEGVPKGVDNSWLVGTNVSTVTKPEPVKSKKKHKKKSKKQPEESQSSYHGMFSVLDERNSINSEEEDKFSENKENTEQAAIKNIKVESHSSRHAQRTSSPSHSNAPIISVNMQKQATNNTGRSAMHDPLLSGLKDSRSVGLDDFGPVDLDKSGHLDMGLDDFGDDSVPELAGVSSPYRVSNQNSLHQLDRLDSFQGDESHRTPSVKMDFKSNNLPVSAATFKSPFSSPTAGSVTSTTSSINMEVSSPRAFQSSLPLQYPDRKSVV